MFGMGPLHAVEGYLHQHSDLRLRFHMCVRSFLFVPLTRSLDVLMLRRCGLRGASGGVHGYARRFCATRAHAGIFVDAENLQGFLKRGGASR